ncbi:hypothetical protein M9Y10_041140 [Tritrichomonas musculus]|uniref:Uncharacterized protein n=1 Tax=Tritrichomonas musculus TaxID=1915356 RepID=A0ABR2K4A5_9EUKA
MSQARTQTRKGDTQRSLSRTGSRKGATTTISKKEIDSLQSEAEGIMNEKKVSLIYALREMKKAAIEGFNFDKSSSIQAYLNYLDQDNTAKVTEALQNWLRDSINDVIGNYESNMEEVRQQIEDNEVQIRESVDQIFEEMKKRHIKEIEDNETLRNIEILREEKREKNDVRVLKKQSQNLAKSDEVEQAKLIFNKANEVHINNQKAEQENIKIKYNNLLDQICLRQRTEIEALQQRLEDLINQNEKIRHEDEVYQQKQVAVFIRHTLQKSLNDASKQLNKKENLAKVTQELKSTVIQILREQEREYLLDGELD